MKKILFLFVAAALFAACSKEYDETPELDSNGTHTIDMFFNGGIDGFDGEQTRATTSFPNGATIYIDFGSDVLGTAVYNSSTNKWTLTYSGTLANASGKSCTLRYFTNIASSTSTKLTFDYQSVWYGSYDASYSKTNNSITVSGTMTPYESRVRFKGSSGKTIQVSGYSIISSYEHLAKSFKGSNGTLTLTVQSSGYTPYLYYYNCDDQISVVSDGTTYTMETTEAMRDRAGKTGYLTIPTSTNHGGWTTDGSGGGGSNKVNGHEYVDLGLSVKWATCNVGASEPEEYGDYYAWGETTTKSTYDWSTYKWCNGSGYSMTKYCTSSSYGSYGTVDNKKVLELADDVARAKWGGTWRMPTKEEQDELRNNCTWTWTTQNEVKGYKVTSKTNSNYIFLPAAGYRGGSSLYDSGSTGSYWSSSLSSSESDAASDLEFDSGKVKWYDYSRRFGFSVRAVCP